MTGAAMSDVLQAFALLCLFLLLGVFLRAKLRIFQSMFIPASVIGGMLGLVIGPALWGDATPIAIPGNWMKLYALLPGVLIVPVVASVPLGITLSSKGASKTTTRNIFNMFFLMLALFGVQLAAGGLIGAGSALLMPDMGIYATFGLELPMGYSGGHGTAGVLGSMLHGLGLDYWEIAQGVAVTYASIGLIGGILAGIGIIRWLSTRGYLEGMNASERMPKSWLTGLEPDVEKQRIAGRETTVSTSIDVLAFNLALILAGSGLALWVSNLAKNAGVPLIAEVPVWAYAIIVMWVIWFLMNKLRIAWVVDQGIKSKIASTLTDFAIVAAFVSMPVQAVLTFWGPILITAIAGFAGTVIVTLFGARLFQSAAYERVLLIFGTATGVFLTGLLLLKICDPEFKSPALLDGSLAYSMYTVLGFVLLPIITGLAVAHGPMAIGLFGVGAFAVSCIGVLAVCRVAGKEVELLSA